MLASVSPLRMSNSESSALKPKQEKYTASLFTYIACNSMTMTHRGDILPRMFYIKQNTIEGTVILFY